jgi:hypothetical protein
MGICIRWGVMDRWESASTMIPVELGDRGEVMMGAGIVCLFRYLGVIYGSLVEPTEEGVRG